MDQNESSFQYTFLRVVYFLISLVTLGDLFASPSLFARSVLLNGQDASNIRSQEMKNVNVFIDEHGNIFLSAPHYQIKHEETFLPLSKAQSKFSAPQHQPPKEITSAMREIPKEAVDAQVKTQPNSGVPIDATPSKPAREELQSNDKSASKPEPP